MKGEGKSSAESPGRKLTPQEELGILRDSLGTVGEQMRNFPVDSDKHGFVRLFRKQERLEQKIQEIQDSIIPALGYGTTGEYSITSANKPKR